MATPKLDKEYYTFEEYLTFDGQTLEKYEYHNGEVVAMSGGSLNHAKIGGNVVTAFNNALDKLDKNCSATNSELKVYMETINRSVYPDVMLYCGDAAHYKEKNNIITNPTLIVEVLSKSTKSYDKGLKFEQYRTLPTFREYMIVYQTIPKVQTWYKEAENLWRISSAFGLDSAIKLYSMGCTITLKNIYKRVNDLKEEDDLFAY